MSEKEKHSLFRQKKVKNQYVEALLRGLHKGAEIGGGSGGEVVLEELTVTKNGVYEPREEVKLGGTYTFKEDLGNIDFEALFNAGMAYEDGVVGSLLMQGGEYGIALQNGFGLYLLIAQPGDKAYLTQTLKDLLIMQGAPVESLLVPCWISMRTMSQVPAPTITIPESEDNVYVSLSLLNQLFETEIASNKGYNKVIVDVTADVHEAPNLQKLTATENGTYIPDGFDGYNEVEIDVPKSIIEASTEEEMESLLTSAGTGIVVRYLGEEGTYKTGALYLLEEDT